MVARGQPSLLVGDFNVEPTKIPCLAKGISAGLWFDFEESWALATGLQPVPLISVIGALVEVIVGTLWLVVPLLFFPAGFSLIGGLHPILRFGLFLIAAGGLDRLLSRCSALPFGLLLGCLLFIRVGRGSKSAEVQRVWGGRPRPLPSPSRVPFKALEGSPSKGYP